MALEFQFQLGPPATAEAVGDVLVQVIAEQQLARSTDATPVDPAGGFLIDAGYLTVHTRSPLPFSDPMDEVFGFVPVVHTGLRVNRLRDAVESNHDLVTLLVAVLARVSGEAWFGFNGELTYLTRIGDRITIDGERKFWTPELVALLPPHDRAPLPDV